MFFSGTTAQIPMKDYSTKQLIAWERDSHTNVRYLKVDKRTFIGTIIPYKRGKGTFYGVCFKKTEAGKEAPCLVSDVILNKECLLNWNDFNEDEIAEAFERQGIGLH